MKWDVKSSCWITIIYFHYVQLKEDVKTSPGKLLDVAKIDEVVETLFNEADGDKDDHISFPEFLAQGKSQDQADPDMDHEATETHLTMSADKNKDLNSQELDSGTKVNAELELEANQKLFNKLDKDSDGQLSMDEAREFVHEQVMS